MWQITFSNMLFRSLGWRVRKEGTDSKKKKANSILVMKLLKVKADGNTRTG